MIESLVVYGFGSFFMRDTRPRDIDLLLLHRSLDDESCHLAIACKAEIKAILPNADIVMLSQDEADDLQFLTRAKTVLLGELQYGDIGAQARALIDAFPNNASFAQRG